MTPRAAAWFERGRRRVPLDAGPRHPEQGGQFARVGGDDGGARDVPERSRAPASTTRGNRARPPPAGRTPAPPFPRSPSLRGRTGGGRGRHHLGEVVPHRRDRAEVADHARPRGRAPRRWRGRRHRGRRRCRPRCPPRRGCTCGPRAAARGTGRRPSAGPSRRTATRAGSSGSPRSTTSTRSGGPASHGRRQEEAGLGAPIVR
jgi:hypothetical protein